jgi:hypothetical protein
VYTDTPHTDNTKTNSVLGAPELLQNVLSRLGEITTRGDGSQHAACCPAHEDKRPSLSIRTGDDGRVLLKCHAGCETKLVLQAIGLDFKDLFLPETRSSDRRSGHKQRSTGKLAKKPEERRINWEAKAKKCAAALTPLNRDWLAHHLGIPDTAFDTLPVGYLAETDSYTFPERDHEGKYCGILCRFRNKDKKTLTGSTRALTVPHGWDQLQTPVLVPEGSSDTLTLTTLGIASIGRPNSTGGINALKYFLATCAADRPVVILGERDQKPGGNWPGQDGAIATAQAVANHLGRQVMWAFPPAPFKDVRDWVRAQEPDLWAIADAEMLAALGRKLLELVLPTATVVEPVIAKNTESAAPSAADGVPAALATPDPSKLCTPEQYYREHVERVAAVMHTDGRFVTCFRDQQRAAVDVIIQAGLRKSLTIVPSNKLAAHLASTLRHRGLDAQPHPQITEDTCLRWNRTTDMLPDDLPAGPADRAGMPVASFICPNCPHSKAGNLCAFQEKRKEAIAADHLIITANRAATNPGDWTSTREAVLLVEVHPIDVVRPTRGVMLGDDSDSSSDPAWVSRSLRVLHQAASHVFNNSVAWGIEEESPDLSSQVPSFWRHAKQLPAEINTAAQAGNPVQLVLPPRVEMTPRDCAIALWSMMANWPEVEHSESTRPNPEITRLFIAAVCGRLDNLFSITDGYLAATWPLTHFPAGAAVLDLGGLDDPCLNSATGENWNRISELDDTKLLGDVTQIGRRVTASSSPRQLAGVLRPLLAKHKRVGLVAERGLLNAVWKQLEPADQARVGRCQWFYESDELKDCDVVLCLGLP